MALNLFPAPLLTAGWPQRGGSAFLNLTFLIRKRSQLSLLTGLLWDLNKFAYWAQLSDQHRHHSFVLGGYSQKRHLMVLPWEGGTCPGTLLTVDNPTPTRPLPAPMHHAHSLSKGKPELWYLFLFKKWCFSDSLSIQAQLILKLHE